MNARQKLAMIVLAGVGLAALAAWRIDAVSDSVLKARYPLPVDALALSAAQGDMKNGERLAHLGGCFGCHGENLTGRAIFSGWFGTRLVAPNLTRAARHRSDRQLAAAIRYGVKPDGTSLFDMPSGRFLRSSDSDIAAIVAYLRTLPEKPDAAGKTQWRIEGRALLAMRFLPPAAAEAGGAARGPLRTPSDPMARGRYLAQSQCSACHGPDLSGDTIETSPDLRFAIQHYSLAAFQHFFATGNGRIGHGTKIMTKIIRSRLHYLTAADVRALFVYLNTPARAAP